MYSKIKKRIMSTLLTIIMLFGTISSVLFNYNITANAAAYYPEGWQSWKQWDSRWKNEDGCSVGATGCFLMSFCKAYIQAGLIEDTSFTPNKFIKWAHQNGGCSSDCSVTTANIIHYPDTIDGVGFVMHPDSGPSTNYRKRLSDTSKKAALEEILKYRNDGYQVIIEENGSAGGHFILVGDPFINSDGNQDVHLYDTGFSSGADALLDSKDGAKIYSVKTLRIFCRADGVKCYPGQSTQNTTEASDANANENELKNTSLEQSESKTKLYRLARYNERQKQSLALLQNKSMTTYELAAMKWNMIVTQFCIPYMNNIYDVLNDNNWKSLVSSVSSINFERNTYLTITEDKQDERFLKGSEEYLNYLKTNSSKLSEILTLLNDPNQNVYTQLYASDKTSTATLNNLLNDTALYVHDSQTMIGSAIQTRGDETVETTEVAVENAAETQETADLNVPTQENQSESESETESKASQEQMQGIGDTTISSNVAMWDSMSKMHEISNKDAKTVYSTILEKSTVKETNVPVFVSTDATILYNNIFISNAMEIMTANSYYSDVDTSRFLADYSSAQLVIDRWGNICAKINDNYVIVYPSYANPLFVSTQLDDGDLAGVYYETLNKQLAKYDVELEHGTSSDYLFSSDSSVQINVADAVKKINNYTDTTKDGFVGYTDSFKVTTCIDNQGIVTSDRIYDRLSKNFSISKYNPPMYRFDTTTVPIASKPILSMMPSDKAPLNTAWYYDLKKPYFDKLNDIANWEDYIAEGNTTNGELTFERFGTYVGFRITNGSATANFVEAEDESDVKEDDPNYKPPSKFYSLLNSGNILVLSNWSTTGDIAKPIFNYPVEIGKSSGYVTTFTNINSSVNNDIVKYPFMLYFDGVKGNFKTSTNRNTVHSDILIALRSNNYSALSANYVREMTYDNLLDSTSNVTMYENLYALEYLDSERFNIYVTLNGNIPTDTTLHYTRVANDTYLDDIVKGYYNTGVVDSDAGNSSQILKLVSVPLLATTVDDTSGWGMWTGMTDNIDSPRDTDTTVNCKRGFLNPYSHQSDYVNIVTNGLKYVESNYPISNSLRAYPIEDIISIAFIWDTYYINNAPICKKLEVQGLNAGTLYPENTVLTPYNGISDGNNNTLFWTRESNGSTTMSLSSTVNGGDLAESKYSVYKDVYVIGINYPIFLLAINKNADSTNLQRWVDALKDTEPDEFYIMDLITNFYKHPITGMRNFMNGCMQYFHNSISKSTLGSVFNIQCLFNYIWYNNGYFWFMILYGIFVTIGMFIVGIRYMSEHLESKLLVKEGRVIVLGLLPILLISFLAPLFREITGRTISPITNKTILTEVEGYKRAADKLVYGIDGEVLLDDLVYVQEDFADLKLKILTRYNEDDTIAEFTDISLLDLYKSVSVERWSDENITYSGLEDTFGGLGKDTSKVWYNTEEFVPVHYDKYDDSVFYYFYDWIKSNYIQYYSMTNNITGYEKPTSDITNANYMTTIKDAEKKMLDYSGGIFGMYTDSKYINLNNGLTDIFGLSYLFKMTDDNGLPVQSYDSTLTIEDWASKEFENGILKLSDYDAIVNEDTGSVSVSPVAGIICSPYWDYYKTNTYLHGTDKDHDNKMLKYSFTPDYIQELKLYDYDYDFTNNWQVSNYIVKDNVEGRIPWRLYASNSLLERDVANLNGKYKTPLPIENKLFTLNRNIYRQVLNLCDLYETNHISDDTMIFVSSLVATFEFNKMFGSRTTTIDIDTISTDKVFRGVYATAIEDVIDKPNLVYMIYSRGGFFTTVVFVLSEALFVVCMYVRCLIYLLLVIAAAFIGFSECYMKEENLLNKLKGLFIQMGVLLLGQFVLTGLLRIMSSLFVDASKGLMFIITLAFGIISYALMMWHIKMLISLVKDMSSFGFAAFSGELNALALLAKNAKNNFDKVRVNNVSGRGIRISDNCADDNSIREEFITLRRKNNSDKLNYDSQTENSEES